MSHEVIGRRLLALTDLVNRLTYITVMNGYSCDAGNKILLGEAPKWGPNDPPAALAVAIAQDTPETRGGLVTTRTPFQIYALVPADMSAPLLSIERLIQDIKQAVEIEGNTEGGDASIDRYLGVSEGPPDQPATLPKGLERGPITPLPREAGSTFVGAIVEYVAVFQEGWGRP